MNPQKILVVLVNFGNEQINYLEEVIRNLRKIRKYEVRIIVNSNIKLNIEGVDELNIFKLDDYQLLPLTCRKVIWDNRSNYDIFIYGENDHLFTEDHIDNHIYYSKILPKNRIAGLIQFEEDLTGKYFPAYHGDFDWDLSSVEIYEGKKFAHFSNVHQATFILTKEQLERVGRKFDFTQLKKEINFFIRLKNKIKGILGLKKERLNKYSVKCKVNTDVYNFGGMKKMICISEFEKNLIHHLPNLYINGDKGRNKYRSDSLRMEMSINTLLNKR